MTDVRERRRDCRLGFGYGSAWHLMRYLAHHRDDLNRRFQEVTGVQDVKWLDFPWTRSNSCYSNGMPIFEREWTRLEFLGEGHALQREYNQWWPSRGNQQNWDAIGKAREGGKDVWLLVEAKAHLDEITRGTQASPESRDKIAASLTKAKKALGISPDRNWLDGYYQYANRITTLHFLNSHECPARLLFIYFTGDNFDGKVCPADEQGWQSTVLEVKRDLGLADVPETDHLKQRIHDIFLPVLGE